MKSILKKCVFGLTSLLSLQSFAMPVFPTEAKDLKSYEFSELVKLYMQDENSKSPNNDWAFNSDNPNFIWKTNGVEEEKVDYPVADSIVVKRKGIIRMNILGTVPQVLGKSQQEVAWDIVYSAPNDTRFGVKSIELEPYQSACFGALGSNCDLKPFKSLKLANINYQKICRDSDSVANFIEGYKLTTTGKKPIYLAYTHSAGSGGESTFFALKFEPDNLCK